MKNVFILITLSLLLTGCAALPPRTVGTSVLPKPYPKGVYHAVLKGQTLWRIAKAYNTDIREIIEVNKISDPSKIDKGQMIFIPGAKRTISGKIKVPTQKQSKRGYVWPVRGRVVSYYGSKIDKVKNKGIDIEAKEGQVLVAARSGKVVFCDEKVKGLGKTIIIEHDNGYSTLYANNSSIMVACGDYVRQNQPIAKVGSTGRTKRPKLHFQIRKGHEPQNPFYYLP